VHEELAKTVIELLDVTEHTHERMVRIRRDGVNAVTVTGRYWISRRGLGIYGACLARSLHASCRAV